MNLKNIKEIKERLNKSDIIFGSKDWTSVLYDLTQLNYKLINMSSDKQKGMIVTFKNDKHCSLDIHLKKEENGMLIDWVI